MIRTAVRSRVTTSAILIERPSSVLRQWALRAERRARVVVARIPEHPAGGATLVRAADLIADLGDPEDPAVEGIVAKVLQPRPDTHVRVRRALADQSHALPHDLVGVLDGIA